MPVLTRSALEGSPLADLHLIASELGLDGFRKLRKADLVDAILDRQSPGAEEADADDAGAEAEAEPAAETSDEKPERRSRRGSRGGRGRSRSVRDADDDAAETDKDADADADAGKDDDEAEDAPRRRSRQPATDKVAEGVVELLGNGSAFLRVSPPEPSDDDVYISAAQVRRCELVSGDRISGPVRAPRRSERYPSLQRVDTINDRPADEVAEGTPFDSLPVTLPSERLVLGADDPTLKAIEWLTPIGRGSRVTITGGARAGKSEALRLLAGALHAQEGLEVSLVLAGVRPEELPLAPEGVEPTAQLTFAASADSQAQAIERAVETAKRVAARGGHAVLLIDTLDGVQPQVARRALAAARTIVDGGSLTIVATSSQPVGGETTVIALDPKLAATRRLPALDLVASGTMRPELLVGDAGAEAIAQARLAALGED